MKRTELEHEFEEVKKENANGIKECDALRIDEDETVEEVSVEENVP